jgi:cobalt/nickel transport system ATP-binding protein
VCSSDLQPPFLLSGGEKQKVALASLLAVEPQLLLLDEPSASLDPATVGWLIDTLLDSNMTVVAATHNLSLAAELGSRCLVLGTGGQLLYDGPVAAALGNLPLLEEARLAHRHRHRHDGASHTHLHTHDWDGS